VTRQGKRIGNRLAPARFVAFVALLVAGYVVHNRFIGEGGWQDSAAMAFDFAAACFMASLLPLLRDSSAESMRRHADENDANRLMVLIITSGLAFLAMAAISGELPRVHKGNPFAAVKLVTTLILIWLFANSVYALHYAHIFYSNDPGTGDDCRGLDFPGTKTPTYTDFVYFAFTLGMTFQTSDVAVTRPAVRQIAILHCFAAFVFNIGVIAFTINALGGSA
jgi:uncharacterized membrane protein